MGDLVVCSIPQDVLVMFSYSVCVCCWYWAYKERALWAGNSSQGQLVGHNHTKYPYFLHFLPLQYLFQSGYWDRLWNACDVAS